jgi:hypothetical protein
VISATQCRCARTLLRSSVSKLSNAASGSEAQSTISNWNVGSRMRLRPTLFDAPLRMPAWFFYPKTTFNQGRTCRRRDDHYRASGSFFSCQ